MLQNEQIYYMPFIDRMEVHRDLMGDEMAGLKYLVSYSETSFLFSLFSRQ